MLRQSYLPIFDLINLNLYLTLKQNKMKKIMKHKFQYMLLLLLAIPCHSFAGEKSHVADSENLLLNKSLQQSVTIKGNVTDAAGEPLIGVSVLVKGTTNGTITDFDGNFSLSAQKGDILEISYIGYATQSVTITNNQPLKIVLKEDTKVLDEVVVTALGIKREQKALSYNVQQVKNDAFNTVKEANFMSALVGKVAGVTTVSYTHLRAHET